MERIEMVEKLREKTGLSYEDAWNALEKNGWVLVDAMLWLEKEKKIEGQTAVVTTRPEESYEPVNPAVDSTGKSDETLFDKLKKLLIMSVEHSLVVRRKGKVLLRLPVLLLIVLLFAAFYIVVIGLLAGLFCGCQFAMEGPKVKADGEINKFMRSAEEAAARVREEVTEEFRGTDNSRKGE